MITVRFHYTRPDGDYRGWNLWVWPIDRGSRQYDLRVENGVAVTSITVPSSVHYVNFILRKSVPGNAWAQQERHAQRIGLRGIVSGDVDYYVNQDVYEGRCVPAPDAAQGNKILSAVLDYDRHCIRIRTAEPVADVGNAFRLLNLGSAAAADVTVEGGVYVLTPVVPLALQKVYRYRIAFGEEEYPITLDGVYMSNQFREQYHCPDAVLGAVYSADATEFTLWAPTAEKVQLALYESGTGPRLETIPMDWGEKGLWQVTSRGDRKNVYYTYLVTVDGETVETCDPYARSTGVNGQRAMVVDLPGTDPEGWAQDHNPNPLKSYTDAVLYELHVRDFSMDDSSGIRPEWKGKFLALTQRGTKTPGGVPTGLDHLRSMGITHLHLLPFYDYASVDESRCDSFNWGYDPLNFNVPEGSYATDPYHGEIRVRELKQTVQALHDNGISVVMDVVYNHVYDAATFCFNKIVPGYFSRWNEDGSYSNGSGCGNDTASERDMVRKYIVDSVLYWCQEYHLDGFRFDLVGLLDVDTINAIVTAVHAVRPDVIFYGEGWDLQTAVEGGAELAIQRNAHKTPGFAYFSDTTRDLVGGRNGGSRGFVCGLTGREEQLANCFRGRPGWCSEPAQVVQYCSCHDNYTLADKLALAMGRREMDSDLIRRNNLAAAICIMSQGIPFIHAGEELLRQKTNADGTACENSYNAQDYVNQIRWGDLEKLAVSQTRDYYRGLIALRKRHKALRLPASQAVADCVRYQWITNEVVSFRIDGRKAGDISQELLVIFNGVDAVRRVELPEGVWNICVDARSAGTEVLGIAEGYVNLPGISAMVLFKGSA